MGQLIEMVLIKLSPWYISRLSLAFHIFCIVILVNIVWLSEFIFFIYVCMMYWVWRNPRKGKLRRKWGHNCSFFPLKRTWGFFLELCRFYVWNVQVIIALAFGFIIFTLRSLKGYWTCACRMHTSIHLSQCLHYRTSDQALVFRQASAITHLSSPQIIYLSVTCSTP